MAVLLPFNFDNCAMLLGPEKAKGLCWSKGSDPFPHADVLAVLAQNLGLSKEIKRLRGRFAHAGAIPKTIAVL